MKIPVSESSRNNYYARRLSSEERAIFDACVDGVSSGNLTVKLNVSSPERIEEMAEHVFEAINYGCPELFYVEQNIRFEWEGERITFEFTDKYPGENIGELWKNLNAEAERMAAIICKFPETRSRIERLNRYLCARVKPVSVMSGSYGDAYGALIRKEARCEGFAKAAMLIMSKCGIECIIAHGTANTRGGAEDHAWNIIACDGKYYQFDFTWNAGAVFNGIEGVVYNFLDDEEMAKEHNPESVYPACNDNTMSFWARNNGIMKYHSDLSKIRIVPSGKNYVAVARLPGKLTEYEIDNEVMDWMHDELAAYNFGVSYTFSYNEPMDLLVFYFINK